MKTPSESPVPGRAPHRATPAFSRPVAVDDIPDDGLDIAVEAEPAECAAVADDIDLPAVRALAATFRLRPRRDGRFHLEGEVTARITQTCVVSLEPFDSELSRPVEMTFAHAKAPLPERNARRPNHRGAVRRGPPSGASPPPPPSGAGEVEPPDPIVGGRIDLGAVAVEFLTLGLDFYPRKPGVHFSDVVMGERDDPRPSTFAALERLKDPS